MLGSVLGASDDRSGISEIRRHQVWRRWSPRHMKSARKATGPDGSYRVYAALR